MTSFTTVLGLVPLALGLGEGSELQAPMAITVIGGLTICTFLTLFVIPALYVIAAGWLDRNKPQIVPVVVGEGFKPSPTVPASELVKTESINAGNGRDRSLQDIIVMPAKALAEPYVEEGLKPVQNVGEGFKPSPTEQEEPKGPQLTRRQTRLLEHIKKSGKVYKELK